MVVVDPLQAISPPREHAVGVLKVAVLPMEVRCYVVRRVVHRYAVSGSRPSRYRLHWSPHRYRHLVEVVVGLEPLRWVTTTTIGSTWTRS